MNYESKYNELVEAVRAVVEGNRQLCNVDKGLGRLRDLLPEKESEDERIRKALLRCCDDWEKGQYGCMNAADIPSIRAYLEKQKKQSTLNFYVPEGADINSTKNKIAVILGQYKSQGFIEDEEYYSMLKYIGEKEQQPEVDLEEEIKKYCRDYYNCNYPDQIQNDRCAPVMPHIVEAARRFYELGLNARK